MYIYYKIICELKGKLQDVITVVKKINPQIKHIMYLFVMI